MSDKCYYKILDISIDASPDLIRKSFIELVKEWHPDRCNHPDAEIKMIEINEAYEVLKDEYRRYMYDNENGYYLQKQKNEAAIFDTLTNLEEVEAEKQYKKNTKLKENLNNENNKSYSEAYQRYQMHKNQIKKEKKVFDFEELASKKWFLPVAMFFISIVIILFSRM